MFLHGARWLMAWLMLGLCMGAQAALPVVLWLTTDVTPAPRTAMIERLARAQGLSLQHLEYPLRGSSTLTAAEANALDAAVTGAAMVWVDAPHVTAQTRLERLLTPPLSKARNLVWVTPEATSNRIAAYLQAGGERNTEHALTLSNALIKGLPAPELPAPQAWPSRGLYHPDAPGLFNDAQALSQWQLSQGALRGRPAVVLLVHRYHFVNGATEWIDAWLRMFAKQGLFAYAAFGQQVDAAGLSGLLEVTGPGGSGRHLHAQVVVIHQLLPQGAALQPLFARWGAPVLLTQPHRSADTASWEQDEGGLSQSDVPFYLAQPEGAGAIDPILVVAHADQSRRPELIERQAQAVVAKARRLITLQTKPAADKRLVAMVYNYPPGGSHFGASFLNVPRSLEQVSGNLAQAGYTTHAVPESQWVDGLKPMLAAYYPGSDLQALLASNQAAPLPLKDYEAWWATLPVKVRQRIEAQWGTPGSSRYVVSYQGQRVFVIPRMQVGQLSVLPQPPREETLHLGQNPFMHRSKTPLSHHYLAVYLWARQADALIHFGTHGTQEWAPGKARSLDVWDDALLPLGDVPVVYPYIVDNLGEALTAKRRGRAVLVSHKTPVFSPAGFEAKMAHMHELMHEWETVDAGPTRQALERQLIGHFVEHQLHRDLGWTAERIAANFSGFLELLHPYLDTLAQSSQPKGLAVFGRVPEAAQRHQTILQSLRKPLIEALGEDIDEAFLIDHQAVATARPSRWLDVALLDAQKASTLDLRPALPDGPVPNRAARKPIDSAALFKLAERAQALEALLSTEGEMPGLLTALSGHFITAAYGGDPIRNPDCLPTGRNLTGLDPSRLPTRQAYEVAKGLFNDWLKTWRAEHGGQAPTRMALSLWAGETLRHQGIMEAQALVALGVEPVWDESGRPAGVRVIPASTLQRPRVDVLLSITGSYRDQFPALMALVDQAVAAASTAEPANAVSSNTAVVAAELVKEGVPRAQAQVLARARVFGNVGGDYGTGLSEAVQSEGVQRNDSRLGDMFLQRMSQPYMDGQALEGLPAGVAAKALGSHLRHTQAAVLSRTSHLYAMVTSDDPFQYLGGLAAAARSAGKTEALGLYVNQLQDASEVHTQSAATSIALEMQSRYLHPGWLQAQKAEGYAGTLQVLKALQFAWGWQVTAPDTVRPDHWQNFYEVLVQDKHKLGLPQWLRTHPQAYAQSLERLVQAQRMGYWQPDAATQQQVAQLYKDLTREAPLPGEMGAVRHWVAQQLNEPTPPEVPQAARPPSPVPTTVQKPMFKPAEPAPSLQGLLLQRQPDNAKPALDVGTELSRALAAVLMTLLVAGGASWQALRRPLAAG
ncbi:cobaltochelatase subunit CobN [Aquabacterium sp. CECT 9606]|uniref:cobaltochelatase subunit CobN n=1 Tax=Aquabacterium sp. CECT 9606 TaxID=2845822 RepID=UPI001E45B70D|nr:cobaltochelatase subunit CobN [Aquabacterium sp. CECT 9606]CAH0354640.1 Aerobic cobaltochelatase subunit CobN [Aquabacterium sp. CECT 9606]